VGFVDHRASAITLAMSVLTDGVDVYFLATGSSVEMIEDQYGHITPVKNADRIPSSGCLGGNLAAQSWTSRADGAPPRARERFAIRYDRGRYLVR
jgi:hypothetical protein